MEEVEITVVNWKKYNPEGERVKTPHWFRINKDMALSDSLDELDAEQCWVWIQILSECCRKNSATIVLKVAKIARFSKVSKGVVCNTLELLEKHDALRRSAESTPPTEQNITEQTEQTEHNRTNTVCVELASPDSPLATLPLENFVLYLSLDTRNRIERIYPDKDFVIREVEKMKVWLSSNPQKSPKSRSGWSRFVMGWLERGWDRHRKTIQSAKADMTDWANVFNTGVKNASKDVSRRDDEIKKRLR